MREFGEICKALNGNFNSKNEVCDVKLGQISPNECKALGGEIDEKSKVCRLNAKDVQRAIEKMQK